MKKILSFLISVILFSGLCAGFASAAENGKISVVTTIFPEYDWVRAVAGETGAADITLLLDSGVDLHSYQPTADDIIRISTCDLFVYVGGESDEWVEDVLKEATNPDMIVIDLMETLGDAVKEEELVEGMEGDEEEEEEEEPEYDEHVWLSLKNASVIVRSIADALGRLTPAYADAFAANAAAYTDELNALDAEYRAAADAAVVRTLLFGDRFPFRYMTDDYGLDYYAAFAGCSAESEASFETIAFLAEKVNELGLSVVLKLEHSGHRIAETVVSAAAKDDVRILSMDSLQSTTARDVKSGATYLSAMEKNLEVLKEALK